MYTGRICAVTRATNGAVLIGYRISSRSFGQRTITVRENVGSVVPIEGSEDASAQSGYVLYNCLRHSDRSLVLGNGSHVDPLFHRIESGVPIRDAMASTLLGMDYEFDSLSTPRICIIVERNPERAWLGIVRRDGLVIEAQNLEVCKISYLTTYIEDRPKSTAFASITDAGSMARAMFQAAPFSTMEYPVVSLGICMDQQGFTWAVQHI